MAATQADGDLRLTRRSLTSTLPAMDTAHNSRSLWRSPRRLWRFWWVAAALALTAAALVWAQTPPSPPAAAPLPSPATVTVGSVAHPAFVKSGNISAWNITNAAKVFADAERLALDTITVPVRVNMAKAAASEVSIDKASLAFAHALIVQKPNYRYIVEPYPWIADGGVPETDLDPADKAAWFASYQRAVVALGKEFPTTWGLYVASNLVKVEDQSASWIALIKAVRAVYPGKVIYRTQWWVTAQWAPELIAALHAKFENPLFGAVDVIAIAAYFELSEVAAPSYAQVKAALRSSTVFDRRQDVFAEAMALQARWHKPLFLGELSCPALDFGAQNPWDPASSAQPNSEIQKNYLQAYLETFVSDPSKFLGFSLFTIGHPVATPYDLAPSAAAYVRQFRGR